MFTADSLQELTNGFIYWYHCRPTMTYRLATVQIVTKRRQTNTRTDDR